MKYSNLQKFLVPLLLATIAFSSCGSKQENSGSEQENPATGSVIFIHPDGSGEAMWTALRLIDYGPDGFSNWDGLSHAGLYRVHQRNALSTTSHAGATTHAFGVKVDLDTFGNVPEKPVQALSGSGKSIMHEAMDAGMSIAVINSGHLCEPGTAVFLANSFSRYATDSISAGLIESGADIILGGGEILLLPEGEIGRHGEEGRRKDGKNLITEARAAGYDVVFTRDELLALPSSTERVFGVFAAVHSFNDRTEEQLAELELPLYKKDAPTLAEMTREALRILTQKRKPFLLVVEEEGSDNFANVNNAKGAIEALRRADEAIGVAISYAEEHPNTLVITAADSDAGAMTVAAVRNPEKFTEALPQETGNGAPLDGIEGTGTPPFMAAPDASGHRMAFGVAWADFDDHSGGVVARAHGMNAARLPVNCDNTDIYRMMYLTLFGTWPGGANE